MTILIRLRVPTGPRPGKTCVTRLRPERPSATACGADVTAQDCLQRDFEQNVKCELDWAKNTDLEICPKCLKIFQQGDKS